jgi:large subunit ribosomal protein L35
MKTKKSAAKRFRITATGMVLRSHSHARHILTKKSRKRKRKLAKRALISSADVHGVRRMLLA